MSEFKGTKGEWILDERECRIVLKSKSDINDICDVWGFNADTKQSVKTKMIANAKLIACAPEMLEALSFFVNAIESEEIIIKENFDNYGFENCSGRLYDVFKKLIKKATE